MPPDKFATELARTSRSIVAVFLTLHSSELNPITRSKPILLNTQGFGKNSNVLKSLRFKNMLAWRWSFALRCKGGGGALGELTCCFISGGGHGGGGIPAGALRLDILGNILVVEGVGRVGGGGGEDRGCNCELGGDKMGLELEISEGAAFDTSSDMISEVSLRLTAEALDSINSDEFSNESSPMAHNKEVTPTDARTAAVTLLSLASLELLLMIQSKSVFLWVLICLVCLNGDSAPSPTRDYTINLIEKGCGGLVPLLSHTLQLNQVEGHLDRT
ncbi:hypothetical protein ACJIZ3_001348 [Penstemon smallii]|uniref:Uncharacterized protein n=1 Tax=Penstemon smallii TaxID=265156 RepID=A0ABD3U4M3_9LAMI